MKPYRFRLQSVLALREQLEQSAQQLCALRYAAVETALTRVRAAEAEIDAVEIAHRAQLANRPKATQLEQMRLYALLLHDRRKELERELAEARRQAEEARKQLMLATQHREALERLRDRQRRVHSYHAARVEQNTLDELSSRLAPLTALRPALAA